MHNGVLVVEGWLLRRLDERDHPHLRGHHEPQEEVVFHEIVERLAADDGPPTMVELGAFWAYYTLWVMQRMPSTRAILVELDPNNLEVGKVNLRLNGRAGRVRPSGGGAEPRPLSRSLRERRA